MDENILKTKLVKPIFVSISLLMDKFIEKKSKEEIDSKEFNKILAQNLTIITKLSLSNNEEKVRFFAIDNLVKIVNLIADLKQKKYFDFIKENESNVINLINIFIHILNDEHPELRNLAVRIFVRFNSSFNLVNFNNNENIKTQIIDSNNFTYNSEYIFKKLLAFDKFFEQDNNNDLMKEKNEIKKQFFLMNYNNCYYFAYGMNQDNDS